MCRTHPCVRRRALGAASCFPRPTVGRLSSMHSTLPGVCRHQSNDCLPHRICPAKPMANLLLRLVLPHSIPRSREYLQIQLPLDSLPSAVNGRNPSKKLQQSCVLMQPRACCNLLCSTLPSKHLPLPNCTGGKSNPPSGPLPGLLLQLGSGVPPTHGT